MALAWPSEAGERRDWNQTATCGARRGRSAVRRHELLAGVPHARGHALSQCARARHRVSVRAAP